jgi:Flp pilus assembly protein TadD
MRLCQTRRNLAVLASSTLILTAIALGATPVPLTRVDVMGLLAGGAPADDVARAVQRNDISFNPTPEFLKLVDRAEVSVDTGKANLAKALASAKVTSSAAAGSASETEVLDDLARGAEQVVKEYPPTTKAWAGAEQEYRKALKLDPTNPALHFALASALVAEGKFGAALPDAREAMKAMPNLGVVHVLLAGCLAGSGNAAAGMPELRTAVQVDPESDFSRGALARALMASRDFNGAVEVLREGIKAQPNDPVLHDSLGTVFFEHGDLANAIDEFRRALGLGSQDPQLHEDLAVALRRQGDLKGAIAEFQAAIKLDENLFQAHYLLAEALIDRRDFRRARSQLQEVILLRPDYALAHSELGYVLRHQGDLDGAVAEYRQAIKLEPSLAIAHADLATALWKKGDHEGAYRETLAAHELAPNNPAISAQFDRLPERYKRLATQPPEMAKPPMAPLGDPPKPDFVYYLDSQSNSLLPLEAEVPTLGGKAGPFRTTGYLTVIGERSPVRLKVGSKWNFVIRAATPGQKLNFRLERFRSKGGSRTFSFGTKVVITSNPKKPGLLNFTSTSYRKSSIELAIPYDLVPGEYGFFVSADTGGFEVFCFGVDGP